jgi:hypothetical protein
MPLSAPIRVRLFAKDVDDMPINFTRADIHLAFGGRSVPMSWVNRGSNEYTADVPTEFTAQPGLYALVVTASKAWNKTTGQITRCELLRRNVRIVSVATTVDMQYIILGVLVGLAILALGTLLGCQIRSHKDKAKMFVEHSKRRDIIRCTFHRILLGGPRRGHCAGPLAQRQFNPIEKCFSIVKRNFTTSQNIQTSFDMLDVEKHFKPFFKKTLECYGFDDSDAIQNRQNMAINT